MGLWNSFKMFDLFEIYHDFAWLVLQEMFASFYTGMTGLKCLSCSDVGRLNLDFETLSFSWSSSAWWGDSVFLPALLSYLLVIMQAMDFPGKKRIFMMNKTTSEIIRDIFLK